MLCAIVTRGVFNLCHDNGVLTAGCLNLRSLFKFLNNLINDEEKYDCKREIPV